MLDRFLECWDRGFECITFCHMMFWGATLIIGQSPSHTMKLEISMELEILTFVCNFINLQILSQLTSIFFKSIYIYIYFISEQISEEDVHDRVRHRLHSLTLGPCRISSNKTEMKDDEYFLTNSYFSELKLWRDSANFFNIYLIWNKSSTCPLFW